MNENLDTYIGIVAMFVVTFIISSMGFWLLVDHKNGWPEHHLSSFDGFRQRSGGRVEKAATLETEVFDTIFVGTSRTFNGLNPLHSSLAGSQALNLGFSGTNYKELDQVIDFALEHQEIETVVLETSLLLFNPNREPRDDFKLSRFGGSPSFSTILANDIFGRSTWLANLKVIQRFITHKLVNNRVTTRGFRKPSEQLPQYRSNFKKVLVGNFLHSENTYLNFRLDAERLNSLEEKVSLMVESGIEVKMFFPPVHALQLEVIHQMGHLDDYKTLISTLVSDLAELNNVEIWNFSGFGPVQREPIPDVPDKPMFGYTDSSHFTSTLGGCILHRMAASQNLERWCKEFGTLLNEDNVQENLNLLEQGHARFHEECKEEVTWVHSLLQKPQ